MANGEQDQLCVMFHGVNVTVGETHILNDVYGGVQPGQLMAVMGPSGKLILLKVMSRGHKCCPVNNLDFSTYRNFL